MATQWYLQKLKDPRWQRKRLEILNRDEFTCLRCGDRETELHIHHNAYKGNPWEISNEHLETLCKNCHAIVEKNKSFCPFTLINDLDNMLLHGDKFSRHIRAHFIKWIARTNRYIRNVHGEKEMILWKHVYHYNNCSEIEIQKQLDFIDYMQSLPPSEDWLEFIKEGDGK